MMPLPPGSSRPRRAIRPTPRRVAAAATPSSTAPTRVNTSKVTKKCVRTTAERKSDNAVTADIVGRTAYAEPESVAAQ